MNYPLVSIIIPCFNEANFIEQVIHDILNQDFPKEKIEVLFLDGMSTDSTPQIIQDFSNKHSFIHLIENQEQFVPQAMNLGIRKANGEIIIRLDAHASYPNDYISKLVFWQKKLNADNVGGIWKIKPSDNSLKAKAIAKILAHPVGVGNSLFRLGVDEPKEVDTVPFGCYPKFVFEKYGFYDERLNRNQDIELNKRIRRQGGKIVLVPDVECTYFARGTISKLWENNYGNGKWVILAAWFTKTFDALSIRHFVPLGLFVYILLCLFLFFQISKSSFFSIWGIMLLPLLLYFSILLFFSIKISIKEKNLLMIPYLLMSFLTLHISYGVGSIAGIFSIRKK